MLSHSAAELGSRDTRSLTKSNHAISTCTMKMTDAECMWKTCEETFPDTYEMLAHVQTEHVIFTKDQLNEIIAEIRKNRQNMQPRLSTSLLSTTEAQYRFIMSKLLERVPTEAQLSQPQLSAFPAISSAALTPPSPAQAFKVETPQIAPTLQSSRIYPIVLNNSPPQMITPTLSMQSLIQAQNPQEQLESHAHVSTKAEHASVFSQDKLPRMTTATETPQMNQSYFIQQMNQWRIPPPRFFQMNGQAEDYWNPQPTQVSMLTKPKQKNRVVPEQSPASSSAHSPNSNLSINHRPEVQLPQEQAQNHDHVSTGAKHATVFSQAKLPRMTTPTETPQMNPSYSIQRMTHQWRVPPSGLLQMNGQTGGYWNPQPTQVSMLTESKQINRVFPEQSPSSSSTHSPNSTLSTNHRPEVQNVINTHSAASSASLPAPIVNSPPEVEDVVENLLNQRNPEQVVIDARPLLPQILLPQDSATIHPIVTEETKPKKPYRRHDLWVRYEGKWHCTWGGCGRTFLNNDHARRHYDSVHLRKGKGPKNDPFIQLD